MRRAPSLRVVLRHLRIYETVFEPLVGRCEKNSWTCRITRERALFPCDVRIPFEKPRKPGQNYILFEDHARFTFRLPRMVDVKLVWPHIAIASYWLSAYSRHKKGLQTEREGAFLSSAWPCGGTVLRCSRRLVFEL